MKTTWAPTLWVMAMEEEFELGQTAEDEVKAIKTVGDAVNYVAGKLNG